MSATVTRNGQVTIPKRVRDRFGLTPGSRVDFAVDPKGRVELVKVDPSVPASRFGALRGRLADGPSTDEVLRLTRGD